MIAGSLLLGCCVNFQVKYFVCLYIVDTVELLVFELNNEKSIHFRSIEDVRNTGLCVVKLSKWFIN